MTNSNTDNKIQFKECQKKTIKTIVQVNLEITNKLSKQKKELDRFLRILKMDLDDLKAGRLENIVERQSIDVDSRKLSVFHLSPGVEEWAGNKWYKPYNFKWNYDIIPEEFLFLIDTVSDEILDCINSSVANDFTIGSYPVGKDREIVHIRT